MFPLGDIRITAGASALMGREAADPVRLLYRHERGDWGNLPDEDRAANDRVLREGGRLVSRYCVDGCKPIYVSTEADRSVTTICLPEEV